MNTPLLYHISLKLQGLLIFHSNVRISPVKRGDFRFGHGHNTTSFSFISTCRNRLFVLLSYSYILFHLHRLTFFQPCHDRWFLSYKKARTEVRAFLDLGIMREFGVTVMQHVVFTGMQYQIATKEEPNVMLHMLRVVGNTHQMPCITRLKLLVSAGKVKRASCSRILVTTSIIVIGVINTVAVRIVNSNRASILFTLRKTGNA